MQRFCSRKLASASTLQAARTEATVARMEATAARMAAGGGGGGGAAAEHARMRSSQGSDEAQDDAVAEKDVSAMVPVGATEHIASPTREVALGGQPSLCPGCHNHPSLRLPWQSLPEKVATGIEHFSNQMNSLWSKGIIDEAWMTALSECFPCCWCV